MKSCTIAGFFFPVVEKSTNNLCVCFVSISDVDLLVKHLVVCTTDKEVPSYYCFISSCHFFTVTPFQYIKQQTVVKLLINMQFTFMQISSFY